MTCREKLTKDEPSKVDQCYMGGASGCPHSYGYLPIPKIGPDGVCLITCVECWDREIPDTKPTCTTDAVHHPKHYGREGAMECIDEMVLVFGVEAVMNFCVLNAWKYRYRAADKHGAEDLEKSDWYLAKYAELKGGD